jgi:hypothetical protein
MGSLHEGFCSLGFGLEGPSKSSFFFVHFKLRLLGFKDGIVEIMLCLKEDFQTSSWILQAMKLLRFVGYHKVCEQRYSVIAMKVKNIAKK